MHLLENSTHDFNKGYHSVKKCLYFDTCITAVNSARGDENFIEQEFQIIVKSFGLSAGFFINNCQTRPNLCKYDYVDEIVNFEKCLIRFIENSNLSDLKIVNFLDILTDNENFD